MVAQIAGHPFGATPDDFQLTGDRYALSEVQAARADPAEQSSVHREELRRPRRGDGRRPAASRAGHLPQAVHLGVRPGRSDPAPGRDLGAADYEGELAVVIGRVCSEVPASRVPEVIFGYTCANDVTARDLQAKDGQWTRAKGFDTFCPLGPWIETDLDPADLALVTRLNDEVKQQSRTSLLLHNVGAIISFVSQVMTLLPGDVVLTGTPAGSGRWTRATRSR